MKHIISSDPHHDMNAPSIEVTNPTDEVAPTAAGLYRLYDQRWIGVFAMVSPIFFHRG